ncbi:hypothetical protein [Pseudanabaena mucicola]|uniref:Uncharacterized protein n=1 Tax=Pseudanabaena mucicola FACHB-723 TaxID=2692860 RepID=A0ABR8A198_9CYAN|nr:hypothetical protein [Pseudanabaena mucicola]MBD2190016.1 hypothetical protein [Pseudanabaena mucicola FACHB-723]
MEVAISGLTGKTQAQIFRSKSRCMKTTKQLIDLAKSMNARITDLSDGTKLLTFRDGTKRTVQCQDSTLDAVRESVQELGEYLSKHPDQISNIVSGVMEILTAAEYFAKASMHEYTTDRANCRRIAESHLETLSEDYPHIFTKKNATRELN